MLPSYGQGYLVMDATNNPNVLEWEVTVIEKEFIEGVINKEIVAQDTIKVNYTKVAKQYLTDTIPDRAYFVNIKGYAEDGSEIIETGDRALIKKDSIDYAKCVNGLSNWGPAQETCSWVCDGKYYSWELTYFQATQTGDPDYFELTGAIHYVDSNNYMSIPYYRYVSDHYFNNVWCNQPGNNKFCNPPMYPYTLGPADLSDKRSYCGPTGNSIS